MPHLYKLEIQGIVYLVDPATTAAYTYDLTNPTMIGHVIWPDASMPPQIALVDGWSAILENKRLTATAALPTASNATGCQ